MESKQTTKLFNTYVFRRGKKTGEMNAQSDTDISVCLSPLCFNFPTLYTTSKLIEGFFGHLFFCKLAFISSQLHGVSQLVLYFALLNKRHQWKCFDFFLIKRCSDRKLLLCIQWLSYIQNIRYLCYIRPSLMGSAGKPCPPWCL